MKLKEKILDKENPLVKGTNSYDMSYVEYQDEEGKTRGESQYKLEKTKLKPDGTIRFHNRAGQWYPSKTSVNILREDITEVLQKLNDLVVKTK